MENSSPMWCAWRTGKRASFIREKSRQWPEDLFFVVKAGSKPNGCELYAGIIREGTFLQRKSVFDFLFYSVGRRQIVIGVN